ncbi:type I-G CRISPR-associated protein Cas8g1/Csx17 [Novipirellula sp. SH528]|uniref:type I-G CRISPR-associated protein Cas8g1/Csx17 n=1 Tax=Novipirellula sp. SH528 TaxID=3454466 RepID=UPI003FA18EB0
MSKELHTINLKGCSPTPLAHYLKALGVLRLVAEQADSSALGWWKNDSFWLRSKLDEVELATFFLEDYSPTPLVGPWGARSGFFPASSEKSAREAIEAILASDMSRFQSFQSAVVSVQVILADLGLSEKADSDEDKLNLLKACRANLNDDLLKWLDAVYVLLNDGRAFPPLLGTGGNEGSGSYMSGFAQQVVSVILKRQWDHALRGAIFDTATTGIKDKQTPGHFHPEAAGGPNATSGFDGSVGLNPWDYILALEGCLLFAASTVKRLDSKDDGSLSFPFCVRPSGVGYQSSDLSDESSTRAEMWFPLWDSPTSLVEVEQVLGEGRATISGRNARNGIDFARSVASLGIDRGISEFQRYGFQQRNGLSNFAIPLGRFVVPQQEISTAGLLAPLDHWLDRFRRAATGKTAPARAGRALRQLESSILNLCRRGDAADVQATLIALGEAEASVALSKQLRDGSMGSGINPLPLLSDDWLVKSYDGTCELRLAAALASITHATVGPIRRHLEPIDSKTWRSRYPKWASDASDPAIVWTSGSLTNNLIAVLNRRMIDVMKGGKDEASNELLAPLRGRLVATLPDIAAFIDGTVNDERIESLFKALCLIDFPQSKDGFARVMQSLRCPQAGRTLPDAGFGLLKLCYLPHKLNDVAIVLTPRILRRAMLGDGADATRLASRRLTASGFVPAADTLSMSRQHAQRTAAALMFPISKQDAKRLARRVLRQTEPSDDVSIASSE